MQTTRIITVERGELCALGQAISHARTQQNISIAELARTIGITHERLLAIEAGEEDPGYKLLRAIATALNICDRTGRPHVPPPPRGNHRRRPQHRTPRTGSSSPRAPRRLHHLPAPAPPATASS